MLMSIFSAETGLNGLTNVHIHRSIDDVGLAEMYRNVDVILLFSHRLDREQHTFGGDGQRVLGCSD
jgi:hypothetical protein